MTSALPHWLTVFLLFFSLYICNTTRMVGRIRLTTKQYTSHLNTPTIPYSNPIIQVPQTFFASHASLMRPSNTHLTLKYVYSEPIVMSLFFLWYVSIRICPQKTSGYKQIELQTSVICAILRSSNSISNETSAIKIY